MCCARGAFTSSLGASAHNPELRRNFLVHEPRPRQDSNLKTKRLGELAVRRYRVFNKPGGCLPTLDSNLHNPRMIRTSESPTTRNKLHGTGLRRRNAALHDAAAIRSQQSAKYFLGPYPTDNKSLNKTPRTKITRRQIRFLAPCMLLFTQGKAFIGPPQSETTMTSWPARSPVNKGACVVNSIFPAGKRRLR